MELPDRSGTVIFMSSDAAELEDSFLHDRENVTQKLS